MLGYGASLGDGALGRLRPPLPAFARLCPPFVAGSFFERARMENGGWRMEKDAAVRRLCRIFCVQKARKTA